MTHLTSLKQESGSHVVNPLIQGAQVVVVGKEEGVRLHLSGVPVRLNRGTGVSALGNVFSCKG